MTTQQKSTPTLDEIKKVAREAMETALPVVEIMAGSPKRFAQVLEKLGVQKPKSEFSIFFGGIPIREHPHLPEDIAVLVEGGHIVKIFNLSEPKDPLE